MMWRLVAVLLAFSGLACAQNVDPKPESGGCPAHWFNAESFVKGMGCILFDHTGSGLSWIDAAAACQNAHGGRLLKIASVQEREFLAIELAILEANGEYNPWWTGASDFAHEGVWTWPDLSVVGDFAWDSSSSTFPRNDTRYNAASTAASSSAGLRDDLYTGRKGYICQKESGQTGQSNSPGKRV